MICYSYVWEQRKLGDVFKEYSEKHHEDLEPLTIIQGQGTILRSESDRNLQYDKAGLVNYKLVNKDDFILHLRSFEGGLEVANSQGIVSPAYHIFHGEETDSRFYYPFFRSHFFINVLLKPHVYGIRDGKSIDVESMKEILIPYPKYDEQKAMGDYFDSLDNLITLHQCKPINRWHCEKNVWEQRKFDEVFLSFANKNYQLQSSEYCESGKYPIIDQGKKAIIGYSDNESKVCDKYPCIIFGDHTTELKYVDFPFIIGADGVKTLSVKGDNTLFQYYNLQINNVQPTGYNRHFSMLKEVSLFVPQLEEQKKIGEYFSNLDTLITLHQRKPYK